jgi:hypothetical protein
MSRYRDVVMPAMHAGFFSRRAIGLKPRRHRSMTSERFTQQGVSEQTQLAAIARAEEKRTRKGKRSARGDA